VAAAGQQAPDREQATQPADETGRRRRVPRRGPPGLLPGAHLTAVADPVPAAVTVRLVVRGPIGDGVLAPGEFIVTAGLIVTGEFIAVGGLFPVGRLIAVGRLIVVGRLIMVEGS
jgi:hypothetical protein